MNPWEHNKYIQTPENTSTDEPLRTQLVQTNPWEHTSTHWEHNKYTRTPEITASTDEPLRTQQVHTNPWEHNKYTRTPENTSTHEPLRTQQVHTNPWEHKYRRRSLFTGLDYWTGLLDWTTGLTFDLKCSIYMKKFMFYLCEKNYIDWAHGFFAVQYSIVLVLFHLIWTGLVMTSSAPGNNIIV